MAIDRCGRTAWGRGDGPGEGHPGRGHQPPTSKGTRWATRAASAGAPSLGTAATKKQTGPTEQKRTTAVSDTSRHNLVREMVGMDTRPTGSRQTQQRPTKPSHQDTTQGSPDPTRWSQPHNSSELRTLAAQQKSHNGRWDNVASTSKNRQTGCQSTQHSGIKGARGPQAAAQESTDATVSNLPHRGNTACGTNKRPLLPQGTGKPAHTCLGSDKTKRASHCKGEILHTVNAPDTLGLRTTFSCSQSSSKSEQHPCSAKGTSPDTLFLARSPPYSAANLVLHHTPGIQLKRQTHN